MLDIFLGEVPDYLSRGDVLDVSMDFILDLVSAKRLVYYRVVKVIDRNRSFADPRRRFGGNLDGVIVTRNQGNIVGSKCQVKTPQGYESGKRSQETTNKYHSVPPLTYKSWGEQRKGAFPQHDLRDAEQMTLRKRREISSD
jgi:hypothetical protein